VRTGRRALRAAVLVGDALLAVQGSYLLLLLAAAARRFPAPTPSEVACRFLVVVPAHDESLGLLPTLTSLRAQDHPAELVEVVVVADNCKDDTAEVARRAGARVWERTEPALLGKGHALAWAFDRALAEPVRPDAVVVVDADCTCTPGLLTTMAAHLAGGARAVQARDDVANLDASWNAALRAAAMLLFNTVRMRGKQGLGASVGLSGTGMCLRTDVLEQVPWRASSLSEDIEQHVALVRAGVLVRFADGAGVRSAVPTTRRQAAQQELRWEAGRLGVARRHGLPLLREGLQRRDRSTLVNGLDALTLPHTAFTAAVVGAGAATAVARSRPGAALLGVAIGGQAGYVLGGLALVGAPPEVWRALLRAPVLVAAKVPLFARVLTGRGPLRWVRTERA